RGPPEWPARRGASPPEADPRGATPRPDWTALSQKESGRTGPGRAGCLGWPERHPGLGRTRLRTRPPPHPPPPPPPPPPPAGNPPPPSPPASLADPGPISFVGSGAPASPGRSRDSLVGWF